VGYLKVNLAGAQTEPGLDDGLEVEQVYLLDVHQGHGLGRTSSRSPSTRRGGTA
jgi:hypothetical protein